MHLDLSKERVLRFHLGAVIAIHAVNAVMLWMRYLAPDFFGRDTLVEFFSVSSEGKIPTWFSGLALVACAVVLAVIAVDRFREGDRLRHFWALLSAIFFYISFDEVTHVHEEIGPLLGDALGASGFLAGWVVPAMLVLLPLGLAYLRFLALLPARSRWLIVAAGVVFVGGALGMELVGNAYRLTNERDIGYGIIATIEEIFEMGGIVIFLYALLDHLEREVSSTVTLVVGRSSQGASTRALRGTQPDVRGS